MQKACRDRLLAVHAPGRSQRGRPRWPLGRFREARMRRRCGMSVDRRHGKESSYGRNDRKQRASRPLGWIHLATSPCLSCDACWRLPLTRQCSAPTLARTRQRCTADARRHRGVCAGPFHAAALCRLQHAVTCRRSHAWRSVQRAWRGDLAQWHPAGCDIFLVRGTMAV
jgi:hypothetical protein